MKPKKKPKPFVVYMWTTYAADTRSTSFESATTKRMAEKYHTDDLQRGLRVGPLTSVELQRPVKAEKR